MHSLTGETIRKLQTLQLFPQTHFRCWISESLWQSPRGLCLLSSCQQLSSQYRCLSVPGQRSLIPFGPAAAPYSRAGSMWKDPTTISTESGNRKERQGLGQHVGVLGFRPFCLWQKPTMCLSRQQLSISQKLREDFFVMTTQTLLMIDSTIHT